VLAMSFERIHRTNLIGMGILPLRLPERIEIAPGDRLEIDAPANTLAPRARVPVRVLRQNGDTVRLEAMAAVETRLDVRLLQHGGVMPMILHEMLGVRRSG